MSDIHGRFETDPALIEHWQADKYIEIVKENNEQLKKHKEILDKRIQELKHLYKQKEDKIKKENQLLLTTLGNFAKHQEDLRSTKTTYVWDGLSGDVVIRKADIVPKNPGKKRADEVEKMFPDYVEVVENKKIDWRGLKKRVVIQNGKPYDSETGEDLSDLIEVEQKPEEFRVR